MQKNTVSNMYLCMFLFDVSLEPLEGVRRFVVDLASLPETEEQVLTATLGEVTVIDVKGQLLSALKQLSLQFM